MGDSSAKYIYNIPVVPEKKLILSRLGFRSGTTVLSEKDESVLEKAIRDGLMLCEPKAAFRVLEIVERDDDKILLEGNIALHSSKLSALLKQSQKALIMAGTAGSKIVDRIRYEIEKRDTAYGAMLDAVASETADAILGWLMGYMEKNLLHKGLKLTRHRYSAGYGDLPLGSQRIFYDILNLDKLGIELTESFMLVPEKSVTAICGIEQSR
ncbi:MAG TPA: methionine synthase [Clostridiaceae bacterium]|nr:methionine synthase [Clostridiaceae bacterium]